MNVILQKRFRTRLKEQMEAQGLNQTQLAERMGVGSDYVYQYLSGRRSPGFEVVERFAKALEIDAGLFVAPEENSRVGA